MGSHGRIIYSKVHYLNEGEYLRGFRNKMGAMFVERLRTSVSSKLDILRESTSILNSTDPNRPQTDPDILHKHVCGRASRALGFFLRGESFRAASMVNSALDHAILTVHDRWLDEDIVIDATYTQFLPEKAFKELGLQEVMVFRQSRTEEVLSSLAQFRMPDGLWELSLYDKGTRSCYLEYDLEEYYMDSLSVTRWTSKLFDHLKGKGLLPDADSVPLRLDFLSSFTH